MNRFLSRYYFISRHELKIRTFKFPSIKTVYPVIISFTALSFVILITSGFFAGNGLDSETGSAIMDENVRLRAQISELKEEIDRVNGRLSTVISMNNEIRALNDLPRFDSAFFRIDESVAARDERSAISTSGLSTSIDDAFNLLAVLEKNLEIQSKFNKDLSSALVDKTSYLRGIPSIKPIDANFNRTSFGPRKNPVTGQPQFHTGLDMGSKFGQEIYATADGIVERADNFSGYGLCVIIAHESGYKTLYGHCSKLIVKKGDRVSRGTLLALVGSTGISTGPHLHYEVIYNGEHLNPADFFFDEEKSFINKSK